MAGWKPIRFDKDKPYEEFFSEKIPYRYVQDGMYFKRDGRRCTKRGKIFYVQDMNYESGESLRAGVKYFNLPGRLRMKRGASR